MSPRRRILTRVFLVLAAAWILVLGGVWLARQIRVTPDRVRRYLRDVDWAALSPAERARVIQKVAEFFNRLTQEERRAVRMNPEFRRFFSALASGEKEQFLELTVPTGFQQAIAAFEQMPEERRRRAIAESIRRLQEAREMEEAEPEPATAGDGSTNRPPELSPELQEKFVRMGIKSFYDSGSADVRAELAPLVEEMQRSMEGGRLFRGRRRGPPD